MLYKDTLKENIKSTTNEKTNNNAVPYVIDYCINSWQMQMQITLSSLVVPQIPTKYCTNRHSVGLMEIKFKSPNNFVSFTVVLRFPYVSLPFS